uniref:ATP-dependent metalloprotease n=1 Tax=Hormidiella parvula TaxID=2058785 RepID=UPI00286AA3EF|nr:ATP-dependent metalloprotease [Hormidiella parvula]WKT05947.1 ATP-dependent metalloprotease [Hormidiella parvula]
MCVEHHQSPKEWFPSEGANWPQEASTVERSARLKRNEGDKLYFYHDGLFRPSKASHRQHMQESNQDGTHQPSQPGLSLSIGLLPGLKHVWRPSGQDARDSTVRLGLPSSIISRASLLRLTSWYLTMLPVHAWMSGARAFWVGYAVLLDARWGVLMGLLNAHGHRYGLRHLISTIDKLVLSNLTTARRTTPFWGGPPWGLWPSWCVWPLLQACSVLSRLQCAWTQAIERVPVVGSPVPLVRRLQLVLAIGLIPTMERWPRDLTTLARLLARLVNEAVLTLWGCIPFHRQVSSFVHRWITRPVGRWVTRPIQSWIEDAFRRSYAMYFRHRWIVPWSRVWSSHLGDVAGHQDLAYELHKAALVYKGGTMLASPPTNSGVFRMMRSLATRYLLIGPAGSGKRLMAHALAADSRVPLLRIRCETLLIGDPILPALSSEKVCAVFGLARALSPCVLLVQGVDRCSRSSHTDINGQDGEESSSSGSGGPSPSMVDVSPSQLLVLLLSEITELKWSGVFLIATTSLPGHIDRALLRKRRFTRVFFLDLPTWFEREDVFEALVRTKGIAPLPAHALQRVTRLTAGWTCSELARLANQVLIGCIRMQTREASVDQVQTAFYKMTRGATKRRAEDVSPARNPEVLFYKVGEAVLQRGYALGDRSMVIYLPPDPVRYRFESLQRTYWETPSLFTTQPSIVPKLAKSLAGVAAKDAWLAFSGQGLCWESLTSTLDRQKDVDIPQAYNLWQTLNDKWPSMAFRSARLRCVHYGAVASEIAHTLPIQPDQEDLKDYLAHSVLRRSSASYRLGFSTDPMFGGLPKDRELWVLEDVVLDWFVLDPSFRRSRLTDDEDALEWIESSRARQRAAQPFSEARESPSTGLRLEPLDPELFESDAAQDQEASATTADADLRHTQSMAVFPTLEQIRAWAPLFEWDTISSGNTPPRRRRVNQSYQRLGSFEDYRAGSNRADSTRKTSRDRPRRMVRVRRTSPSFRSLWLEGRSRLREEASARELRGVDLFLRMTRLIHVSTQNLDHFPLVSASQEWGALNDAAWTDSYRYGMIQDVYGWDADQLRTHSDRLDQIAQALIIHTHLDLETGLEPC